MRKSPRARAGFTLTELLAAMAILILATVIVAAGIPAATQAYVAAVDTSNAQVLLSTTSTRLRDELAVANPNTVVVSNVESGASAGEFLYLTFESLETGYVTSVKYNDELGMFIEQSAVSGEATAQTPLVSSAASAGAKEGLRVKASSITWDAGEGTFSANQLKVMKQDGTELPSTDIAHYYIRALGSGRA